MESPMVEGTINTTLAQFGNVIREPTETRKMTGRRIIMKYEYSCVSEFWGAISIDRSKG